MKKLWAAILASLFVCTPAEARPGTAVTLMAITAYYEARSDGVHGMRAVCHVIRNRAQASGGRIIDVVLEDSQFTVWNPGGPARRRTPPADDPAFKDALEVARMVMAGEARDITHGATHYHERSARPAWAKHMRVTAIVGRHIFYAPRR